MEAKAACKVIAPQRMELSARLPIGTKYCVLSLNVDKDGDISELVQRCIQSENLPPYIEQSILSCAAALLEEDRRAQIKESELVASELDAVEAARLLSRQYNNCTVTWRLSDQSQELRRQVTFSEAHHALMNSPMHGEELRQLEESFKMAIVKSIEDRDQSVAQLRERQHSEMEQAMQSQNDDQIQLLIGKHIVQLDQLESRWVSELEQAKQGQKHEYQKFIIDLYLKDKSQLSADVSKEHKMTPAEKRKSLKEIKPTVSVTPVNPAIASGLSHVTDVYESFTAYLGSQLRVAYNFNLFVGDVLQLCKLDRIKSPQALIESKSALYSNSLAAVVLLCDTGMSMETPTYREFLSLCHSSTEFHFDDVEQQLQHVRRHSKSLQPGDVFITRHSNLGLCHVVFHLCSDKKSAAADQSLATLLQGLKNIMALAAQFDVTTLTVPLLLIDEESRHVLSESQYIRRAETVIKSIRAFLTERLSSNDNALRTIQFSLIQQASELLPDMRRLFESHSSIHHHSN